MIRSPAHHRRRVYDVMMVFTVLMLLLILLSSSFSIFSSAKRGHPKEHKHGDGGNKSIKIPIEKKHHHTPITPPATAADGTSLVSPSFGATYHFLTTLFASSPSLSSSSRSRSLARHLVIDPTHFSSVAGDDSSSSSSSSLAVSLTDSFHVMYTAKLNIGTPPQQFDMILDTGSSCLWVMSADTKIRTRYLHYYDHRLSSSYSPDGSPWDIQYGVGQCYGYLSHDDVALETLIVKNQTFAEAVILSSNFLNPQQPLDGILGMSFAGGACAAFPTFLDNLFTQQMIQRRLFSFHLDASENDESYNEVIFGKPDESLFDEEIIYTPVLHAPDKPPAMWFVHLEQLSIVFGQQLPDDHKGTRDNSETHGDKDNIKKDTPTDPHITDTMKKEKRRETGKKLKEVLKELHQDQDKDRHHRKSDKSDADKASSHSFTRHDTDKEDDYDEVDIANGNVLSFCGPSTGPCIALPDTGTSFLTLPTRLFILLISLITHDRDDCIIDTLSNVFCLDAPDIQPLPALIFTFHSHQFILEGADYILPNKQLAVQVLDFGLTDLNIVILGDVFLRTVYTVFDAEEWRVGFGIQNKTESDARQRQQHVLWGHQQDRERHSLHRDSLDDLSVSWLLFSLCGLCLVLFLLLCTAWYCQWKRRADYSELPADG